MFNKNKYRIIYFLTIAVLISLPYYIFEGKLFIGGDDTRLLYVYPWEWINNIAFFSWFHFSAIGTNNPNQALLPFLSIWSILSFFIHSKVVLDYFSFSLPLIIGFIFFQKLIKEMIEVNKDEYRFTFYFGSLIYILSPIIAINQLSIFLYSAWLIGLLPIITYYFIKYLKTNKFIFVLKNVLWCIFLSFALSTIPWLLGFILPIIIALLSLFTLFSKKDHLYFLKQSTIFFGTTILSQSFWLLSFIINIFSSSRNSFIANVLSSQTKDTFAPTVIATATGNIFYPLLNLFHRQISFDFGWQLKNIFLTFYDNAIIVYTIPTFILFIGLFNYKEWLNKHERKYFLLFFTAFLFSLFFFTVNIGPLRELFIVLGKLPGFVMFRNFYDKFALGYIFIYAIILSFVMIVLVRKYKNKTKTIYSLIILSIMINFIPIKQLIVRPIWTTNNTYANITIPDEYFTFIKNTKANVPYSANMLSLPFNIAGYTIIKDSKSDNTFAGRSPLQLFTGINDFSGNLSFSANDSEKFNQHITQRNYIDLNNFLKARNIGYVFITKNIPDDIKKSYLFDPKILHNQDQKLIDAITGDKITESKNGNYILYKTKHATSLFYPKNVEFKKINPVKYHIEIKGLTKKQNLYFAESFSTGWNLYPRSYKNKDINPLLLTWERSIAKNTHTSTDVYTNKWVIDPEKVIKEIPSSSYRKNPDGTLNVSLTMYFKPQNNFYFGALITLITLLFCMLWLYIIKFKKNEKIL
ncbi:MAG TPA: hypothetical protein VM077_02570 [Candidatus Limnocylindrales bacterium]|nr:hypothetical protein [Candidatus Limnocylindrales bacterium]